MFGNLYKEIKLKGITQTEICKYLGLTNYGFHKKIRGDTDFTSKEMFAIQQEFFPINPWNICSIEIKRTLFKIKKTLSRGLKDKEIF